MMKELTEADADLLRRWNRLMMEEPCRRMGIDSDGVDRICTDIVRVAAWWLSSGCKYETGEPHVGA